MPLTLPRLFYSSVESPLCTVREQQKPQPGSAGRGLLVDDPLVFVVVSDPEPRNHTGSVLDPQRSIAVVHADAPEIAVWTVKVQRGMSRIRFKPVVLSTGSLLNLTRELPKVTPEASARLVD
jgi:hypothetical protein